MDLEVDDFEWDGDYSQSESEVDYFLKEMGLTWEEYVSEIEALSDAELIARHPAWKCYAIIKEELHSLRVAIYQSEVVVDRFDVQQFEDLVRAVVLPGCLKKLSQKTRIFEILLRSNGSSQDRTFRQKINQAMNEVASQMEDIQTLCYDSPSLFSAKVIELQSKLLSTQKDTANQSDTGSKTPKSPCLAEMSEALRSVLVILLSPFNFDRFSKIVEKDLDGNNDNMGNQMYHIAINCGLRILRDLLSICHVSICNDVQLIDSILYFASRPFQNVRHQVRRDERGQHQSFAFLVIQNLLKFVDSDQKVKLAHSGIITTILHHAVQVCKEGRLSYHIHKINLCLTMVRDIIQSLHEDSQHQINSRSHLVGRMDYTPNSILEQVVHHIDSHKQSGTDFLDSIAKDQDNSDYLFYGYLFGKVQLESLLDIERFCQTQKDQIQSWDQGDLPNFNDDFMGRLPPRMMENLRKQSLKDIQNILKSIRLLRRACKLLSYKPFFKKCERCNNAFQKFFHVNANNDIKLCFCLIPTHSHFQSLIGSKRVIKWQDDPEWSETKKRLSDSINQVPESLRTRTEKLSSFFCPMNKSVSHEV